MMSAGGRKRRSRRSVRGVKPFGGDLGDLFPEVFFLAAAITTAARTCNGMWERLVGGGRTSTRASAATISLHEDPLERVLVMVRRRRRRRRGGGCGAGLVGRLNERVGSTGLTAHPAARLFMEILLCLLLLLRLLLLLLLVMEN